MTRRPRLALLAAVLAALAGSPAPAQPPPATPAEIAAAHDPCQGKPIAARVIPVRYRPMADAAQLVDGMLGPCGAYRAPKSLRVITVEDEPERIARIAEAIAGWDIPPRPVEISVSLVMATRDPVPPEGIAPEIRGLSETLSQLTKWTRFTRIGSVTVRSAEGGDVSADLGGGYSVTLHVASVDLVHDTIQLRPLDLFRTDEARDAAGGAPVPRRILGGLEVDLPAGRQHVVGAPGRQRDRAIFLALEASPAEAVPAAAPAAAVPAAARKD